MATKANLSAQIRSAQSKQTSAQSQLSTIATQIADVNAAMKAIEDLKDRADSQKASLDKFDCKDTYYWNGVRFKDFEKNYSQSKTEAKNYYEGLDALADDLVFKKKELLNKQDELNGSLNWFKQIIRSLQSQFEAANN